MPSKPTHANARGAFDAQQLAALLPAQLAGWTQTLLERPIPGPVSMPLPALRAEYSLAGQRVEVTLTTDMPAPTGVGARAIQHARREDLQQHMATLSLRNGILISASSRHADAEALSRLIEAIDLARAETLVRQKK